MRKKITDNQRKEAAVRYKRGETLKRIADDLGIHYPTLRSAKRRNPTLFNLNADASRDASEIASLKAKIKKRDLQIAALETENAQLKTDKQQFLEYYTRP